MPLITDKAFIKRWNSYLIMNLFIYFTQHSELFHVIRYTVSSYRRMVDIKTKVSEVNSVDVC